MENKPQNPYRKPSVDSTTNWARSCGRSRPEATRILDRPLYRTVREVPGPVDMVDVFRRPRDIPPHVDDILAAHPRVVWLQLGIRHEQAAEAFARAGIQVVQDRCLLVEHRRLRG